MTRTVLLTLGRLPKALDLARGFAAAGWRVVVAEPFARHLTGASRHVAKSCVVTAPVVDRQRYLADLLDVIARERVELVVPVSEEILQAALLRPVLPAGVRLHAMPQERLLALHDKARFIERCRSHGLDAPATARLGSPEAAALSKERDVIVKPLLSCSGRGLHYIDRGGRLPDAGGEPSIVQHRVHGPIYSTCSLVHEGAVGRTVIYRGALLSGTVAVCFERVDDQPAIEDWVTRFASAESFSGFLSFDFIVDAGGRPWAIECNPRATSGLHFLQGADVARAIDRPGEAPAPAYRPERLLQQFFPCLTEVQHSFGDWPRFRRNLGLLARTRDVTFRWDDPLPLWTMPWTAWNIIAMARRRGTTFGEVATLDVGWYDAS